MVKSFWISNKKINFTNLEKKYPKRSSSENNLIKKYPYKDSDGDKIMNWFDCKPLNRKKQDAMAEIQKASALASQASRVVVLSPSMQGPQQIQKPITNIAQALQRPAVGIVKSTAATITGAKSIAKEITQGYKSLDTSTGGYLPGGVRHKILIGNPIEEYKRREQTKKLMQAIIEKNKELKQPPIKIEYG